MKRALKIFDFII